MTITDYQLIDYGIEHEQYFTGHSCAFSNYEHCVTGTGDTPGEALRDAISQMQELHTGLDTSDFEDEEAEYLQASEPSVEGQEGFHYYVSVNFNVGESVEDEEGEE